MNTATERKSERDRQMERTCVCVIESLTAFAQFVLVCGRECVRECETARASESNKKECDGEGDRKSS